MDHPTHLSRPGRPPLRRRRGGSGGQVLGAVVAALGVTAPAGAHAEDLRDVAARVETAWVGAGGEVLRRPTRFVMEDETVTLDLRPAPASRQARCRRVALVGARGMSFHVTAKTGALAGEAHVASVAGVVELQGCGGVPDWVKLKSDSGRGALETVVATASTELPAIGEVLLERSGGVLPTATEPGPLPPLAPPGARANLAEGRLAREGFLLRPGLTWTAGDEGKGGGALTLDEGCHHVELFAVEPRTRDTGRHARLDLDGALRGADGELLAEDQTIAPDVRLAACVGAAVRASVVFDGAPRGTPVLVTHAFRPLPPHLPRAWGPEARARAAWVMAAHHLGPPPADAVLLARGASGTTPLPLPVEPGACYVVVAALERGGGRARGLGVRVSVGERVSEDDHGGKGDAAIVAFCAAEASEARIDVESRSSGSGWGVAVFRMLGGAWQRDR